MQVALIMNAAASASRRDFVSGCVPCDCRCHHLKYQDLGRSQIGRHHEKLRMGKAHQRGRRQCSTITRASAHGAGTPGQRALKDPYSCGIVHGIDTILIVNAPDHCTTIKATLPVDQRIGHLRVEQRVGHAICLDAVIRPDQSTWLESMARKTAVVAGASGHGCEETKLRQKATRRKVMPASPWFQFAISRNFFH